MPRRTAALVRVFTLVNRDHDIHGLPAQRRVWGRSLVAATIIHAGLAFWILQQYAAVPSMAGGTLAAAITGEVELAPEPSATPDSIDDESTPAADSPNSPVDASDRQPGTAIEPDFAYLSRAAQSLLTAAADPLEPGALDELARRAQVLEQISSPEEVSRITSQLRTALNATFEPAAGAPPVNDGRPFDYDRSLLTDSRKIESPNELEIRETLTDPVGRVVIIGYIRRVDPATGKVTYLQTQTESDGKHFEFPIPADEFEDAVARNRPYQVINQFSLVKQIHDQAVLPILQKLADESKPPPSEPAAPPAPRE